MKEGEIQLGQNIFTYHEIQEGKASTSNPYFNYCIDFCRRWLNGVQEFELQTSGSTGTPKKILINRELMQLSAEASGERLGLSRGDRALLCINAHYVGGIMMLVRALHLGLRLHVVEADSEPLKNLKANEIPDFCAMVPLQLSESIQNEKKKLEQIRTLIIGGAQIDTSVLEECRHLKNHVYHSYGMTETYSHFALRLISTDSASEHFECLNGYEIKSDERGCLCVRGPVTRGEWLVTNDLAEIKDNMRFSLRGRIDNVINSGGVKLNAELLEARLSEKISGIAFFFAGLPDIRLGEKMVLLVEGNSISDSDLMDAMKDFTNYERPKAIYHLERFEQTASGKLDRKSTLRKLRS